MRKDSVLGPDGFIIEVYQDNYGSDGEEFTNAGTRHPIFLPSSII